MYMLNLDGIKQGVKNRLKPWQLNPFRWKVESVVRAVREKRLKDSKKDLKISRYISL